MSESKEAKEAREKAEAEAAAAKADAGKKVKARVLVATNVDDELHQPDSVVLVSPAFAKANAHAVDTDPAAVKYAESLKKKGGEG
jgi:hypothetical protein